MRILYIIATYLALPIVLLHMLFKSFNDFGYLQRLSERFGYYKGEKKQNFLWVHAVSYGEVKAAIPVINKLRASFPENRVLLTTTTPSGSRLVNELFEDAVDHVYLPFDTRGSVKRFFKYFNPEIAIIIETELWPNIFHYCGVFNVPLVLASACVSDHSLSLYRVLFNLFQKTVSEGIVIGAQTQEDAEKFISLGSDISKIEVTGNIKFDVAIAGKSEQELEHFNSLVQNKDNLHTEYSIRDLYSDVNVCTYSSLNINNNIKFVELDGIESIRMSCIFLKKLIKHIEDSNKKIYYTILPIRPNEGIKYIVITINELHQILSHKNDDNLIFYYDKDLINHDVILNDTLKQKKRQIEQGVYIPSITNNIDNSNYDGDEETKESTTNNRDINMVDILNTIYYVCHKFVNIDINNDNAILTLLVTRIRDIDRFNSNRGYLTFSDYSNNIMDGVLTMKAKYNNALLIEQLENLKNKYMTDENLEFIKGFIKEDIDDDIDEDIKRDKIARLTSKLKIYFNKLYDNTNIVSGVPSKENIINHSTINNIISKTNTNSYIHISNYSKTNTKTSSYINPYKLTHI